MPPARSVRFRLTLAYGVLVLITGFILTLGSYAALRWTLERDAGDIRGSVEQRVEAPASAGGPDPSFLTPAQLGGGGASTDQFTYFQSGVIEQVLARLAVLFFLVLAVLVFASVGVGWIMAGRVLRPVHAITAAARRLSQENLHERLRLIGPADELKELSDTFDEMLERLDRAFQGQRSFIANASHELRTPLAVIRTEIDVGLTPSASDGEIQRSAEVVRDAVSQSERLIDALLVLARSDGKVDHNEVDLSMLVRRAQEQSAAKTAARGIHLKVDDAPPVLVAGDLALMQRLVRNLIDNAIEHNVDGGWARVSVAESNGDAVLRVENGGEVIDPLDVGRLFGAFVRLRPGTSGDHGVGLGLAIVKAIAEAHAGTAEAHARSDGGLVVTVRMPALASPVRQ